MPEIINDELWGEFIAECYGNVVNCIPKKDVTEKFLQWYETQKLAGENG